MLSGLFLLFGGVVFLARRRGFVKKFKKLGNKLSKAGRSDKLKGVTR